MESIPNESDARTGSENAGPISSRLTRKQDLSQGDDLPNTPAPSEVEVERNASGADAGDCWAHDQQPPITGPCKVEYCPTCGMPFEYCEFSGASCSKRNNEQTDSTVPPPQHEQQLSDELREKAAITDAKRGVGKKDGSAPKLVTVQKQNKRRGKCATNIWGLEHFGVKQEIVAKLASRQFACGSSFQKGQPGQAPYVEIQGDIEESVSAFLMKNFDIPEDKIVFLAEK